MIIAVVSTVVVSCSSNVHANYHLFNAESDGFHLMSNVYDKGIHLTSYLKWSRTHGNSLIELNLFPNYVPSSFNYSRSQQFYRTISDNLCVRVFVVSVHTISMYFLCVRCLCEWKTTYRGTLQLLPLCDFLLTFSQHFNFFLPSLFLWYLLLLMLLLLLFLFS